LQIDQTGFVALCEVLLELPEWFLVVVLSEGVVGLLLFYEMNQAGCWPFFSCILYTLQFAFFLYTGVAQQAI
jgi:hypothetical protein